MNKKQKCRETRNLSTVLLRNTLFNATFRVSPRKLVAVYSHKNVCKGHLEGEKKQG